VITDLMARIYQYLYQATGSDLAPVLFYAVVLVLVGLGVERLVMAVLSRLRSTPAAE